MLKLILLLVFINYINNETLCVRKNDKGGLEIEDRKSTASLACAEYSYEQAWHRLELKPFNGDNIEVSHALGFLEGYIYADLIDDHYSNVYKTLYNNNPFKDPILSGFLHKQYLYVYGLADVPSDNDYKETLSLVLNQFDGLSDGYIQWNKNKDREAKLTKWDLYILAMTADLQDIIPAFTSDINNKDINKERKDCTAFVKYSQETESLLIAHNTHNIYSMMNRIFKRYDLNTILSSGRSLNSYEFTSRPADLHSKDDYYTTSSGLVIMETSLMIYNK